MIGHILETLGLSSLFYVELAVALLVAVVGARWTATRTGLGPLTAGALVFAFGAILAITLAPRLDAWWVTFRTCGLDLTTPPALRQLLSLRSEHGLNIVLFAPLGLFIGLIPRRRPLIAAASLALVLPFAVEGIQYLFPELGRACQAWDVVENLLGLLVGLGTGRAILLGGRLLAPGA